MSTNIIQPSFAAGELSPTFLARTDLAKYHSGAATMRNFFVDYRSGTSTRPGTKFVIQAVAIDTTVRLIPFTYSVINTYIIEMGGLYARFISDGGAVLEADHVITGITNANPAAISITASPYVNGDWLYVKNVVGMPEINNRFFVLQGSSLFDVNGIPVDSTGFGAYVSGGLVARVYKIASPYLASDLAQLKYTQNANVMTFTHPNYPPYNLTLTSPTSWAFQAITIGTTALAPSAVVVTPSAAGAVAYTYAVTTVDDLGQESSAVTGTVLLAVNLRTTPGTLRLTWTPPAGPVDHYNVYKAEPSVDGSAPPVGAAYGFLGSCDNAEFIDSGSVSQDFASTPPIITNPFAAANNPSVSCYFQQRQTFAATVLQPETFWMGTPGGYSAIFSNFNISDPIQDDDSIEGTLVSLQVNAIKSLVPMPGGLIALTARGAWQISGGGQASAITPANAQATPQAYNGASDVLPIIINYDILYIQAKGAIVRDLSYNLYANIYTGTDISVLSNHLFYGYQIPGWAYAEEPFKVVWVVRDDGVLLSLTFVKEQEIYGWARHDTQGLFKAVASITEGQVDAVYFVVKRFIGGRWVQIIERMAERRFVYGSEDAWAVDCGVQSSLLQPVATIQATSSTGAVTIYTDTAPTFGAGNVGAVLRMAGGIVDITGYVTPYILEGTWRQDATQLIPDDPANIPLPAASGEWSIQQPSTVFYGLDHLIGKSVSILADGGVVTPQIVAADGSITLAQPATKVTAGLGYVCQLQTMYLDTGEPTTQGKRKSEGAVSIRLNQSRGLQAGSAFDTLVPLKEWNQGLSLGQPIPLITGDERVILDPSWDTRGQICIQVDDPLPATILGLIPEINVGDGGSKASGSKATK